MMQKLFRTEKICDLYLLDTHYEIVYKLALPVLMLFSKERWLITKIESRIVGTRE